MFDNSMGGMMPPTDGAAFLPDYGYESGRHMVFGSLVYVQAIIKLLHKLNYAEPNDWSRPLPTGRVNEVMVILTKRMLVE